MTTVTVVAEDRRIIVDGEVLTFTFPIAAEIWAVQWDGTKGHIEYRDGRMQKTLTSQSEVSAYISAHAAEKTRLLRKRDEDDWVAEWARLRNAQSRKKEVDEIRVKKEQAGVRWFFNGTEDVVQTRDVRDWRNIQSRMTIAQEARTAGVTDAVLPFRAESDITHMLTPAEMIQMCLGVDDAIGALYAFGWGLKAKIDELETDEDALAALDLEEGWPE